MSAVRRFIDRRSVRALTARRSRRLAVLASFALAWAIAVVGVATRTAWVAALGLLLTAGVSLVLAKLAIETTTRLSRLAAPTPKVAAPAREADMATLRDHLHAAMLDLRALGERFDSLERRVSAAEQVGHSAAETAAAVEPSLAAVELAVADSRKLLDKVARHVVQERRPADIDDLSRAKLERPTLSIAIPVFNRAGVFAECLASIETNLADVPAGSG